MNNHTIYITQEQAKKALELGAPIELIKVGEGKPLHYICSRENKGYYKIPTAEQMMGWLEEKYLYITIRYTNDIAKHWQADIDLANCIDPKCGEHLVDYNFSSRKEATIAAIDAALEYLKENKE